MSKLAWIGLALVALIGTGGRSAALAGEAPQVGQPCPWELDHLNGTSVLFGDSNGWYWKNNFSIRRSVQTGLVIRGEYPHARYFSIHGYDAKGRPIDGLVDHEIQPDPGGANPFLPGAPRDGTPRTWTVRLRLTPPPAVREPNTLYFGRDQDGQLITRGTYVYRIYFPDGGHDEFGGVMAPQVYAENDDGSPSTCPSVRYGTPLNPGDFRLPPLADPVAWGSFTALSTIPNPNLGYLVAKIDPRQVGPLVVIRFQRPTFSDTYRGGIIDLGRELRYLSMSVVSPLGRTLVSLPDSLMAVDPTGLTTLVVSTASHKPSERSLKRESATWLDASELGGLGGGEGRLVYRNLLPNPAFPHAIGQVPAGATQEQIALIMGPYFPRGIYCNRDKFQSNGCRPRR